MFQKSECFTFVNYSFQMKRSYYIILSLLTLTTVTIVLVYNSVTGENKKTEISTPVIEFKTDQSIFTKEYNDKNGFEGIVEVIEKRPYDTATYHLTVKNQFVKLNKIKNGQSTDECLIFNLKESSIVALHHNKKMYLDIPVKPFQNVSEDSVKIIRTNNTKIISGLKCTQCRIKNYSENTEITYWVAGNDFYFYNRFLKLWNKTDKCYKYFLSLPDSGGSIPLQQVERTLLRDIKSTVMIHKIQPQVISSSEFEIPSDYILTNN